jgi:hypothetical protein
MERRRARPQLVQPNPHQPQGVRIQDVEAVASVHQHLREPRVADDWIDNQREVAWVGDAVRVILTAKSDGVPRPFKEGGGSLFAARTSCLSRLRWILDMSTAGPPRR